MVWLPGTTMRDSSGVLNPRAASDNPRLFCRWDSA